MSYAMNFRSAFNGFSREDVVNYISYLNSKHNAEVAALNTELERLRAQAAQNQEQADTVSNLQQLLQEKDETIALLSQAPATAKAEDGEAKDVDDTRDLLKTELADLKARCESLEAQLLEAQTARDQAQQALDLSRAESNRCAELELEAYRRAERTERIAKERSEVIYLQANAAVNGAVRQADLAFNTISGLSDQVAAQLSQLHDAITGSKQALADAVATLNAIRPENEKW